MPLSTVLFRLRRLEKRGHAERIPNPDDRRSYLVRLTPRASGCWTDARPRFRALAEAVEATIGEKRVGSLRDGLAGLETRDGEGAPRAETNGPCRRSRRMQRRVDRAPSMEEGRVDFQIHATFESVLSLDVEVIGVDIPIGLPLTEPRRADLLARKFVGPRWPAVFLTPPRAVLEAGTYAEASELARRLTGERDLAAGLRAEASDPGSRCTGSARGSGNRSPPGSLVPRAAGQPFSASKHKPAGMADAARSCSRVDTATVRAVTSKGRTGRGSRGVERSARQGFGHREDAACRPTSPRSRRSRTERAPRSPGAYYRLGGHRASAALRAPRCRSARAWPGRRR